MEVTQPTTEILEQPNIKVSTSSDFSHIIRMLFSCLVDADYLDTERFMDINKGSLRGSYSPLKPLYSKLEEYLRNLENSATDSPVNRIRKDVQSVCRVTAKNEPGFYSLTVPTGGGKTLSSLLWAMLHALHHGKHRIIIAIPYTSIIVQTAAILKSIFDEENVLEHHSNAIEDNGEDHLSILRKKLASENWDSPIIVTTNVQLFESILASKPSKCRKLHNIANSVLILDEVQTLPVSHLQPIVDSLDAYRRLFRISVLFTTASMPSLSGVHHGTNGQIFHGIKNITEIIPPEFNLHNKLRRTKIFTDYSHSSYDKVANDITTHKRVLCIVNTRRDAYEIYSRLPDDGAKFHLSRMMCPAHILSTIDEIKRLLKETSQDTIRVISTQLIEAGVDIDFPIVFRQEAGLDSILQAAGRCNREGHIDTGYTYVFSLRGEHNLPRGYISQAADACMNTFTEDPFTPSAMIEYFKQFYSRTPTFDKGPDGATDFIKSTLGKPSELRFKEAAQGFHLIEESGVTVFVNWENAAKHIAQLRSQGPTRTLMRNLGQYSVSITKRDFDALTAAGAVEEILEGIYWIPSSNQYSSDIGLTFENKWLNEILIAE